MIGCDGSDHQLCFNTLCGLNTLYLSFDHVLAWQPSSCRGDFLLCFGVSGFLLL